MIKSKKLKLVKQLEMIKVHCKLPVIEVKKTLSSLDNSWIAEINSYSKHKYQGD